MTITIIDYNLGNVRSVEKAFQRLGVSIKVSKNSVDILSSEKLLLPGVGHFSSGMLNLKNEGLIPVLNEAVINKKIPILGICLGMQLMTRCSEEGDVNGLNWLNASTKKFIFNDNYLKIPHMGWNTINTINNSELLKNVSKENLFYFVHSYYVECEDKTNILATSNYGVEFVSVFQKENVFGCQFHPEKSYDSGLRILQNFAAL